VIPRRNSHVAHEATPILQRGYCEILAHLAKIEKPENVITKIMQGQLSALSWLLLRDIAAPITKALNEAHMRKFDNEIRILNNLHLVCEIISQ
jgi:hypothetical protein